MMKQGLRVVIVVLTLMITSTNAFGDELKDAKNMLNDVKDSISEKKEIIQDLDKKKESVESQIEKIDVNMNSISEELKAIKNQIYKTDEEILNLTKEIEEKESNLAKEKTMMDARVIAIYKSGAPGYLSVLLGSKSMSELFERALSVKRIMEYDKALIESIQKEKQSIEAKKSEMDKNIKELDIMNKKSNVKLGELKTQNEQKEEYIKSLEKDKEKYEKLVNQEEADAKALQEKIKKIQAQFKPTNNKTVSITGTKYRISSNYGWRIHPVLGTRRLHHGMDIAVPMRTPIYALRDGVVIYSGVMSGYGNVVMINHGDITSLYAHNSSLVVKEGQVVKSGQLITYSGNSGLSSGPHLHFELRDKNGESFDPSSYYK
jgi:murein DD-endopeptidase MepM/ murein hydrolase activator NlpD